jgi:hypothetical protein
MGDFAVERPVRLCCGRRHEGAQCPDGLVMCCLCFERVPAEFLARQDGELVDICQSCARMDGRHG